MVDTAAILDFNSRDKLRRSLPPPLLKGEKKVKMTFMGWKAKDKPEKNKTQSKTFP